MLLCQCTWGVQFGLDLDLEVSTLENLFEKTVELKNKIQTIARIYCVLDTAWELLTGL